MNCPAFCPMLNQYGYCHAGMRPPRVMRTCPHQAVHRAVCRPPAAANEKEVPLRGSRSAPQA